MLIQGTAQWYSKPKYEYKQNTRITTQNLEENLPCPVRKPQTSDFLFYNPGGLTIEGEITLNSFS